MRGLSDAHGVLLIHDEVQAGMGRTGWLFAHQWFEGCTPDIMAIVKALGAGLPVGAYIATSHPAHGRVAGIHGTPSTATARDGRPRGRLRSDLYFAAIDTRVDHWALVPVNGCSGWTEVHSLFLRPDRRPGAAGKMLAHSR